MLATNDIDVALGDIRIPSDVIDVCIDEVTVIIATDVGSDVVKRRMLADKDFSLRSHKMVNDILVTSSMAQSVQSDTEFADIYNQIQLDRSDVLLNRMGLVLLHLIAEAPRFDMGISDEVFKRRIHSVSHLLH